MQSTVSSVLLVTLQESSLTPILLSRSGENVSLDMRYFFFSLHDVHVGKSSLG